MRKIYNQLAHSITKREASVHSGMFILTIMHEGEVKNLWCHLDPNFIGGEFKGYLRQITFNDNGHDRAATAALNHWAAKLMGYDMVQMLLLEEARNLGLEVVYG